jgi:hypothetical protein
MLNVSKLGELDLSTIDLRSLTPEEAEAVRREAYRRARAERDTAMRELVGCLRSWWQSRKLRRDRVVQSRAPVAPARSGSSRTTRWRHADSH